MQKIQDGLVFNPIILHVFRARSSPRICLLLRVSLLQSGGRDRDRGRTPDPHHPLPDSQALCQCPAHEGVKSLITETVFKTFREPRNRFQGRYDNPIPTKILAPIDCSKIPAQAPCTHPVGARNHLHPVSFSLIYRP
jgi:hypothetical protein